MGSDDIEDIWPVGHKWSRLFDDELAEERDEAGTHKEVDSE